MPGTLVAVAPTTTTTSLPWPSSANSAMQITLSAGLTTHHQEQKNLSKKTLVKSEIKAKKKKKTRCLAGEGEEGVKPT